MPIPKNVAVACQGGGSHCAFGAGVLAEVLARTGRNAVVRRGGEPCRLVGCSGTSGGAINALFAWYGLAIGDPAAGAGALEAFWRDVQANSPWDAFANAALVSAVRLQGLLPAIEVAPNAWSRLAQENLGALIGKHLPFARLPELVDDHGPELFVAAANVLSGAFTAFGGAGRAAVLGVEHILASAAVPELFPPVRIGDDCYWDGLLSQNPPIRNFLRGRDTSLVPDEIWIIRINPVRRHGVPTQLNDIHDRRNEMAGNLAIEEEVNFVRQVNQWVARGLLPDKKHVEIREIDLERSSSPGDGLDYASKLDRDPAFIESLMRHGRAAAAAFLD